MRSLRMVAAISMMLVALLATATYSIAGEAFAIYEPDILALRELAGADGTGSQIRDRKVNDAWKSLSDNARSFLTKEEDVVVVVLSSDGSWRYRSRGRQLLRGISSTDKAEPKDFERMLIILSYPYFDQLRSFNVAKKSNRLSDILLELVAVQKSEALSPEEKARLLQIARTTYPIIGMIPNYGWPIATVNYPLPLERFGTDAYAYGATAVHAPTYMMFSPAALGSPPAAR